MTGKVQSKSQAKDHTLTLENRAKLFLNGIEEVVSFDERTVVLNTALGAMSIEGEGLHVLSLSLENGHVTVEGHIDAIFYENRTEIPADCETDGRITETCSVCGYVYEGDEVPDDFVCPLCKHGKEDFVPVG